MREPENAMLHYYVFCFAWKLQAATLSWNIQLRAAPCRDSCPACSGTEQQCALYPHFSQQHNTEMRKGPVLSHCTNLCLCLASHIISWDRDAFWGRMSSMEAATDCCGAPGRSFTTFYFCSSLVEQGGRETTVCVCLCLPTKVFEAKLTQAGLQHSMSPLPGKDHTGPGPKAGSNHFRLYCQEFKAADALPQTKSWLAAAETKENSMSLPALSPCSAPVANAQDSWIHMVRWTRAPQQIAPG